MSILLDEQTRVIVQGFTGDKGTFHAKEMIAYGTNVVGGVTPGKGGREHLGRPVFNTVKEAVANTGAAASLILVPAPFCADAIMEAADAGIRLVVTITDGVPAQDMMRVKRYLWRYAKERRTTLIGPNCAGIISAGRAMMGIMPGHIYARGTVGVVTRSGTLGYEAASQMKALGAGMTTSVGIGGDPINGSSFVDILALFEADPETEAVMMIGEIGGPQEADAAVFVQEHMTKPVVGYVAGLTAPKGRRMGHAGAIISAVSPRRRRSCGRRGSSWRPAPRSSAPRPRRRCGAGRRSPCWSSSDHAAHRPAYAGRDAAPPGRGRAAARAGIRRSLECRRSRPQHRRAAGRAHERRRAAAHRDRPPQRPGAPGGAAADQDPRELRRGFQSHRRRRRQGARAGRHEHARRPHRRHGRRRGHADVDGGAARRGRGAARARRRLDRVAPDPAARRQGQWQDARLDRDGTDRTGGGAPGAPRVRDARDLP